MIGNLSQWRTSAGRIAIAVRDRPATARTGVEIVLAALLAIQVARLILILVAPEPAVATVAPAMVRPADPTIFQRFDAFFRTGGQSSLAEATAAGSDQMRLFGVRVGGDDGGSAIIGLADGRQSSVGVGEEVEPGLILRSVEADGVTLARGASVSRLIFAEAPVGAAPPPPPPPGPQLVTPQQAAPATPAIAVVDPTALMAQASLRPRMQGMAIKGFTVSGGGAALQAAGLQAGDVILTVNGNELTGLDRIAALRGQLANSANAEIRFERNGQIQTTTIRTGR